MSQGAENVAGWAKFYAEQEARERQQGGNAAEFARGFEAGKTAAYEEIVTLLDASLSGDGWDIQVLEWIDAHLKKQGHVTANAEDIEEN